MIDADVVCLYEVFDIQTANLLIASLRDTYHQFFYNVGPVVIGLSSGLFIATKYTAVSTKIYTFPKI